MNTIPTRIALYIRTAQADVDAVQHQITVLRNFAEQYCMTVTKIYIDNGFAGTTLNRPSLKQLLEDCDLALFQSIIALNPERLSRCTINYFSILQKLEKHDILFRLVRD